MGIFRALLRFITFGLYRGERRIMEAADRQFTESPDGIADAYDIYRDRLVGDYEELLSAVAELEAVVEEKRLRLENYVEREAKLVTQRDGALKLYEQAQAADNTAEMAKHEAAFIRFQLEITQIEEHQATLVEDIAAEEKRMQGFERRLTTMQAEVQNLSSDKAAAIADYISAQKVVELNARVHNLQRSADRGPIDAVLKRNQELTAKARVSDRLAGTDVLAQDDEYAQAGTSETAADTFAQALAARQAQRETPTAATAERPEL